MSNAQPEPIEGHAPKKVSQIVIQNPEHLAGVTLAFERGGRLVIEASRPMPSAVFPTPRAPVRETRLDEQSEGDG